MSKTAIALMIAAALALAANPAHARCNGHGKAKAPAAQASQTAKKPTPGSDTGPATTSEPIFQQSQAQLDLAGSRA